MIKNVLIALSFVLFYNLFLFKTGLGLGFTLFLLALNLCFFLFRDKLSKTFQLGIISSLISITFALLISIRDNGVVQFINTVSSLFFAVIALYFYKEKNLFNFRFPHFLLVPFIMIGNAVTSIPSFQEHDGNAEDKPKNELIKSLFKGVLIAAPILIILLLILTSADPIFEKLTGSFLKNIHERIIISLLLFVPLVALGLVRFKESLEHPQESIKELIHKGYELSVVLGGIALLFTAFIIVQFQYLFSSLGERQLQDLGIKSLTYSEYVNKGFFELLVVSVISISVLSYAIHYISRLRGTEKLIVQLLSSTVLVETFLIILSAAQRVNLYQDAHGLTRARVFGLIFLIYLTSILIIYLVKIFKSLSAKAFFSSLLAVSVIFVASLSILNIDGVVATKFPPTVNGETDYTYIASLSTDTYQSWPKIIDNIDSAITTVETKQRAITNDDKRRYSYAKAELWRLNTHYVELTKDSHWQEMNLSKYQAQSMILSQNELFNKLVTLEERVKVLDKSLSDIIFNFAGDRDTSAPLTH